MVGAVGERLRRLTPPCYDLDLPSTREIAIRVRQLCNYLALVCGLGLAWPVSLLSQAALQETAARPAGQLTAGEVALLLNKLDPPAVESVRTAIGASDAMARTVAARIAAVTSHPPFANALAQALANEQDSAAAAEQTRALLMIRGIQAAEVVEARLGSLPSITHAYAEWLATTQPERFVELLPKIASALGEERKGLAGKVAIALDKRPEIAERLLRVWLGLSNIKEWTALLSDIHERARPGQDVVLSEALASAKPDFREATVWDLVERLAQKQTVSTALLDAIAPATAPEGVSDTAVTWEQFGRELIARRHRSRKTPDRSGFLTTDAPQHMADAIAIGLMPQLLETERKALKSVLGDRFPRELPTIRLTPPASGPKLRTVPTPWPGFVKHLLETSKCTPSTSPVFGAVYATYRPNGTIAQLQLTQLPIPSGCEPALTALARLTFMDTDYQPHAGDGELLVLPLGRDFVECSHEESQYVDKPSRSSGTHIEGERILAPRKIRDVKPDYPPAMLERRVQGTVVIESRISRTGCVVDLKVRNSVSPALDFAALRSVSQWVFTPTRLDNEPVPVTMNVTVNFTIR
jgi:TonB family protein